MPSNNKMAAEIHWTLYRGLSPRLLSQNAKSVKYIEIPSRKKPCETSLNNTMVEGRKVAINLLIQFYQHESIH